MVEKDPTLTEYENLIEGLMEENETLKKRIAELEARYNVPKTQIKKKEEIPVPIEPKKQAKLSKKSKKKEEPTIVEEVKQEEMPAQHKILVGSSRRECPECGNAKKQLIREAIDKSIVILDYPRVYGKKLLCGECGTEWRLSTEL